MQTVSASDWLNANQASRLAGITSYMLMRFALAGMVRTKQERGFPPRYLAADLLGLEAPIRKRARKS